MPRKDHSAGRCRFFDQGLAHVILAGVASLVELMRGMQSCDLLDLMDRPE
jgi:hypothetical protein